MGQPSTGKCTAVRSLGPVLARATCYCIPFHPTYRDLALPLNTESVNLTPAPLSVGLAAAAGPRPCSCVRTWLALIEAAAAERWILGAADLLLVALGHSFSLLLPAECCCCLVTSATSVDGPGSRYQAARDNIVKGDSDDLIATYKEVFDCLRNSR